MCCEQRTEYYSELVSALDVERQDHNAADEIDRDGLPVPADHPLHRTSNTFSTVRWYGAPASAELQYRHEA